jgi:hypothetical protein
MNQTEERLRAATRALAGTVPDGSAPPLRLDARTAAAPAAGPTRRTLSGLNWRAVARRLTPLAAAAAVVAVVAVVIAITGRTPDRPPARRGAAAGDVPPYYVTLTLTNKQSGRHAPDPEAAVVRATTTGLALATVPPPSHETFVGVTGGADDRTFVLAASRVRGNAEFPATPVTFYRLRFSPSGPVSLTRLPIAALPAGTRLYGTALSPDGTRLAVASGSSADGKIQVFSLRTGAVRSWRASGTFGPEDTAYPAAISWVRGGVELAFSWQDPDAPRQCAASGNADSIRLLNPAGAGGDLLAASRLAVRVPASLGGCIDGWAQITGDGKTVVSPIASFDTKTNRNYVAFAKIPAGSHSAAGTFLGLHYSDKVDWFQYVLWAGPSGRAVIVVQAPGLGESEGPEVYARGVLRALPFPAGTMTAAW